jgi:hypothetical protein
METSVVFALLVWMVAMAMPHVSPRAWAAVRLRIPKRRR